MLNGTMQNDAHTVEDTFRIMERNIRRQFQVTSASRKILTNKTNKPTLAKTELIEPENNDCLCITTGFSIDGKRLHH